jgi:hypothetical protein
LNRLDPYLGNVSEVGRVYWEELIE